MSAPYIIPFNFQPVNTGASTSGYTVPAGKYARVTISLQTEISVSTTANPSGAPSTDSLFTTGQDSSIATFWLKTGDVVSMTSTSGSGSITIGSGSQVQRSSCYAAASINGTTVLTSRSVSSAMFQATAGYTAAFSGSPSTGLFYEEFNQIS